MDENITWQQALMGLMVGSAYRLAVLRDGGKKFTRVQEFDNSSLTVFFGELNEVPPAVVHAQQEGVADDDEQRFGSGDGHVEPEQQNTTLVVSFRILSLANKVQLSYLATLARLFHQGRCL